MKKLGAGLPLLAAGLCICSVAQAQALLNPFGVDTRFYVAPMFSYTFADNDRATDNGFGGSLAVGKRITKNVDLEVIGFFTSYNVSGSDARRASARQAQAGFPPNSQPGSLQLYGIGAGFNVYAFDGFDDLFGTKLFKHMFIHGDIERGQGRGEPGPVTNYTSTIYNAGLGYNLPLDITLGNLFAPGMALRVQALYRLDQHNHDYIGADNSNYFEDVVINVGLRIPLGGRPEVVPQQPAPQVVPVVSTPPPPPPPPLPPCEPPAAGQPLNLAGCKTGDTIVLKGVNFEFNKARLTPNAKAILNQVADALLARKDVQAEIDGHTDSVGADRYNLKLSQQRADSVKQYLIGRGIDAGRMTTMGFGETKPVADNKTDEGRELNRRVELKITAESNPDGTPSSGATQTGAPPEFGAAPGSDNSVGVAPANTNPNEGGARPGFNTPSQTAPAGGISGDGAPGGAPATEADNSTTSGSAPAAGGAPGAAPTDNGASGNAPSTGSVPEATPAPGEPAAGGAPAGGAPPI